MRRVREFASPRRTLLGAIAVFALARLATLLAIVVASQLHHGDLDNALGKSDGVWYLGIAKHGYGPLPQLAAHKVYTPHSSLAFFPLYPLLVRLLAFAGLSFLGAALVVTAVAGLVAAGCVGAWARPIVGDRGATVLVAMWSMLPSTAVFDLAYSEALFAAAAGGCLLALQRRRWLAAGVAATIGGLTRPSGGALVLAVFVAVGLEVRRRHRLDVRLAAAAVIAPLGLLASLVHVSVVLGRWDGWFWLESTVWRSGFDGGRGAARALWSVVSGGPGVHHLPLVMSAVVCVGYIAATCWALTTRRGRLRPPDAGYAVTVGVLGIGERAYFYVKPRLLLIGFPVLVPVARRVAALPTRTLVAAGLPLLVLASVYNAYLVVDWPKAL